MIEGRRWLRVAEVSALLGVSQRSVRRMLALREIAFVKKKHIGIRIDFFKLERELESAEVTVRRRKS